MTKIKSVTLDAGHGGKDPGSSGNGIIEKHIALEVVKKIAAILISNGVHVNYSRTTDVYLSLAERTNKANREKSDLFVSVHTNAHANKDAHGVETFSHTTSSKGLILSKNIHKHVLADKSLYTTNRGTKTANFAVVRQTKMPSALIELAFITNKADAQILKTKQDAFALAIAKGILETLNIPLIQFNSGSAPNASVLLKKGDRGQTVSELQSNLSKLGFACEVDGIFGQATEYAVKSYQNSILIMMDGIAGKDTLANIKNSLSKINQVVESKKSYKIQTDSFDIEEHARKRSKELKEQGIDNFIKIED